jgi:hypothetical protein
VIILKMPNSYLKELGFETNDNFVRVNTEVLERDDIKSFLREHKKSLHSCLKHADIYIYLQGTSEADDSDLLDRERPILIPAELPAEVRQAIMNNRNSLEEPVIEEPVIVATDDSIDSLFGVSLPDQDSADIVYYISKGAEFYYDREQKCYCVTVGSSQNFLRIPNLIRNRTIVKPGNIRQAFANRNMAAYKKEVEDTYKSISKHRQALLAEIKTLHILENNPPGKEITEDELAAIQTLPITYFKAYKKYVIFKTHELFMYDEGEHLEFGEYTVVFRVEENMREDHFTIYATGSDNQFSQDSCHPHVLHGNPCLGEFFPAIKEHIERGHLYAVIELLLKFLLTYYSGSPHRRIEDFAEDLSVGLMEGFPEANFFRTPQGAVTEDIL